MPGRGRIIECTECGEDKECYAREMCKHCYTSYLNASRQSEEGECKTCKRTMPIKANNECNTCYGYRQKHGRERNPNLFKCKFCGTGEKVSKRVCNTCWKLQRSGKLKSSENNNSSIKLETTDNDDSTIPGNSSDPATQRLLQMLKQVPSSSENEKESINSKESSPSATANISEDRKPVTLEMISPPRHANNPPQLSPIQSTFSPDLQEQFRQYQEFLAFKKMQSGVAMLNNSMSEIGMPPTTSTPIGKKRPFFESSGSSTQQEDDLEVVCKKVIKQEPPANEVDEVSSREGTRDNPICLNSSSDSETEN